ncbi:MULTISPECIES: metal-sulfur cluster assembly factor [Amycolatopsis]|uniref:Metal-sulfur cluster biosynthetic enzyme n=1 Tax=Amycolatopsis echigonensis TaxID=2576905 RepID=A0A2N3X1A5_9PSEU|nr:MULTISPECIES: metal-sulfur cluster assembly factor [Amycolatopsis]PKV99903.1 metal-sulfur cluster biosynthetic enzyme [Amycolatopsis niigatensis]
MTDQGRSRLDVTAMVAGPVTEDVVLDLLGDVIDPELGVDIVNLGLVYGVDVGAAGVVVRMTLTTPGCPLGAYLDDEVGRCLAQLPGAPNVLVDLVWEPRWSPAMMTGEAKRLLGWSR